MDNLENAFATLTDAVEDCTGLWDAVWELVGVPLNNTEAKSLYDSKISEAQSILQKLVSHGLVKLCKGDSWPGEAEQEADILPSELNSVLTTVQYWQPPEEGEAYICFYATVTGKDVWHHGKQALYLYLSS